ncbi:hypothetical protein UF75_4749 [Desulfosporosinus sp. I2]|nr:hypothetical protein UF75_4749 [Desulfosporosinus sp. I2]
MPVAAVPAPPKLSSSNSLVNDKTFKKITPVNFAINYSLGSKILYAQAI